ncbi:MAG TPA: hypothetical protein VGK67_29165 [Myxococcales bacterium]|jgi:hypothetical protein
MPSQARQIAESIRNSMRQSFFADHEYRVLPAGEVSLLDRQFYRRHQEAFAAEGFRHLGDVEDVSLRKVQRVRALIRVMVDRPGTTSASFYRARPPFFQRVLMRLFLGLWTLDTLDLESSFSDGTYLVTTTGSANKLRPPPRIDVETLPNDTPPAQALERHRLRLQAYQRSHPEARAIERHTWEEQAEGQRELDRLKADHARSRGHTLDFGEFMSLGGDKMDEALRQEVWQELRAMAQEASPGEATLASPTADPRATPDEPEDT